MSIKYPVDVNDEEFELVTVFGIEMLFTCVRVDRKTVPSNMYVYEVRHDDDGLGTPVEIAYSIFVNHWGTLLSTTKLDLGKDRYKLLNEDDWNYEGVLMSINEFLSNKKAV